MELGAQQEEMGNEERGTGGLALFELWYQSKTLGDDPNDPWSGYHVAPAMLYKHKGEILLRIRQPKTLDFPGRWDSPEQEVAAWVNAPGKS